MDLLVKPDKLEKLVIADFGLSESEDSFSIKFKGTLAYMSPECFGEGKITMLSDIWYLKTFFLHLKKKYEKNNLIDFYKKGRSGAFSLN